jgi:hypothetical protein
MIILMLFFRPIAKEEQGSDFSNDFWNTSGYARGPCVGCSTGMGKPAASG